MQRTILVVALCAIACAGPRVEAPRASEDSGDETPAQSEASSAAAERPAEGAGSPAPPPESDPPGSPARLDPDDAIPRIVAGISETGPLDRTMTREAFELLMSDERIAARSVRVIPHREGGRPVGVRLYGIRRTSIPAALGFLNGDLLRKINGRPVTTSDELVIAYRALQGADQMVFDVTRRGTDVTLWTRIVGPSP